MLPIWFVYIAVAMRLIGGVAYLKATLSGRAKPNLVTWFLWAVTPLIVFIAELTAGVGLVAIPTLALSLSPLMVFLAGVYKNSREFKLTGFNLVCAIVAILGIILWITTSQPEVAIAAMIVADLSSGLPTVRKSWQDPASELPLTYLLSASSMIITLLTVTDWTFAAVAFPIYIATINTAIFLIASFRPKKKRTKRGRSLDKR